jgi:hypothetical protein
MRHQQLDRLAKKLIRGVPKQELAFPVSVGDDAILIHHDQGHARCIDNGPELNSIAN